MRRVLVVAHPDDEVLWFGGLLVAEPGDWTIICCSIPRADPIRAWKFFDACEVLGAKPRLLPFIESEAGAQLPYLANCLDLSGYDLIATHGPAAEYGHVHHRQIHDLVVSRHSDKRLVLCGFGSDDSMCARLSLSNAQLDVKLLALKKYDHILPYAGRPIPKWEALIERYFGSDTEGLRSEKYIRN